MFHHLAQRNRMQVRFCCCCSKERALSFFTKMLSNFNFFLSFSCKNILFIMYTHYNVTSEFDIRMVAYRMMCSVHNSPDENILNVERHIVQSIHKVFLCKSQITIILVFFILLSGIRYNIPSQRHTHIILCWFVCLVGTYHPLGDQWAQ